MPEYPLGVYIPTRPHPVLVPGVAAVATPIREWFTRDGDDPEDAEEGLLVVDFEAAPAPPATFCDAVRGAAVRHFEHTDTHGRLVIPASEMTAVAVFHPQHGRVQVAGALDLNAIARWLDLFAGHRITDRDALAAALQCTRNTA